MHSRVPDEVNVILQCIPISNEVEEIRSLNSSAPIAAPHAGGFEDVGDAATQKLASNCILVFRRLTSLERYDGYRCYRHDKIQPIDGPTVSVAPGYRGSSSVW